MNNKFFVTVLALGIAALGAAASPSQAATAQLGFYIGPTDSIPEWLDTVTMTDTSLWDSTAELESHDGGSYTILGVPIHVGYTGPGTSSIHTPFMPPPSGHTDRYLFDNFVYSKGNTVETTVIAGPGTVTNNNGTLNFSS